MSEKLLTFLHSGACGDVIASMSVVKELCEKESAKAVLVLDPTGGFQCNDDALNSLIEKQTQGRGYVFSEKEISFLKPLLEVQPYVSKVVTWNQNLQLPIDYNLNEMRRTCQKPEVLSRTNQNLELLYRATFGLEETTKAPWLFLDKTDDSHRFKRDIVIARSTRYQSAHLWFAMHSSVLKEKASFIGTKFEHEVFKNALLFEPDFLDCHNSALEAAKAIMSSNVFISNGTLMYWIGVGLGHKNIINELGVDIPTTYYRNSKNILFIEGGRMFK